MSRRFTVVGDVWPERVGCTGVVVDHPKGYNVYPFDKPGGRQKAGEVVVLLDHDPLALPGREKDTKGHPAWTCVYQLSDLEFEEEPAAPCGADGLALQSATAPPPNPHDVHWPPSEPMRWAELCSLYPELAVIPQSHPEDVLFEVRQGGYVAKARQPSSSS